MDNAAKPKSTSPLLRLIKDDDEVEMEAELAQVPTISTAAESPKLKSALARQLTSFADDLDAQIAQLLSQ